MGSRTRYNGDEALGLSMHLRIQSFLALAASGHGPELQRLTLRVDPGRYNPDRLKVPPINLLDVVVEHLGWALAAGQGPTKPLRRGSALPRIAPTLIHDLICAARYCLSWGMRLSYTTFHLSDLLGPEGEKVPYCSEMLARTWFLIRGCLAAGVGRELSMHFVQEDKSLLNYAVARHAMVTSWHPRAIAVLCSHGVYTRIARSYEFAAAPNPDAIDTIRYWCEREEIYVLCLQALLRKVAFPTQAISFVIEFIIGVSASEPIDEDQSDGDNLTEQDQDELRVCDHGAQEHPQEIASDSNGAVQGGSEKYEDEHHAVQASIVEAEERESAQLMDAVVHSKADIPPTGLPLSGDGVRILRLTRKSRIAANV